MEIQFSQLYMYLPKCTKYEILDIILKLIEVLNDIELTNYDICFDSFINLWT